MSVIKSKRGESVTEFINTARIINIFTLRQCVKFPKRYTFYIGQEIASLASKIYSDVILANSIHPVGTSDSQLRLNYYHTAYGACEALVSKIGIAAEMFGIEEKAMIEWMRLIDQEERLLRGIIKREKEKSKQLFLNFI